MTYRIEFSVPWVHGWQRAGVNGRTKKHFLRAATAENEREIAQAYRSACMVQYGREVKAPRGVPVALRIDAYAHQPDRWPRYLPKWLKPCIPFVTKPDADNIAKLMDGLNRVAWEDDAQVVHLIVRKHNRNRIETSKTTFTVMWTDGSSDE